MPQEEGFYAPVKKLKGVLKTKADEITDSIQQYAKKKGKEATDAGYPKVGKGVEKAGKGAKIVGDTATDIALDQIPESNADVGMTLAGIATGGVGTLGKVLRSTGKKIAKGQMNPEDVKKSAPKADTETARRKAEKIMQEKGMEQSEITRMLDQAEINLKAKKEQYSPSNY